MKKSKSPEDAQRKEWKKEMRNLTRDLEKQEREMIASKKREQRKYDQAAKQFAAVQKHYDRFVYRIEKASATRAKQLLRRIAILQGRLGV